MFIFSILVGSQQWQKICMILTNQHVLILSLSFHTHHLVNSIMCQTQNHHSIIVTVHATTKKTNKKTKKKPHIMVLIFPFPQMIVTSLCLCL
jgi:hypothetical protein